MAKKVAKKSTTKKGVNKSQAIRDYLGTHKNAGPTEVRDALAKQGITVGTSLISKVKASMSGKGKKRSAKAKAKAAAQTAAATEQDRSAFQDIREAGELMFKAVELVIAAGSKEAQQLVNTATAIVKKIRE